MRSNNPLVRTAQRAIRLLWTATVLACLPCLVVAEQHALLVGVSHYGSFPADSTMQLSGPKNDVPVLRAVLERKGFADRSIQVLADGVSGAAAPTRAAILGAMDGLTSRTNRGDFVFLYFAGHGSQMPADPRTPEGKAETDGLHEIFLPADVGRWNGDTGRVDNAIADYELVRRLDALLANGAFVWAVFDACHSATLMRGADDNEIRYRHVDPAALGVPAAAMSQAMGSAAAAAASSAMPALPHTVRAEAQRTRGAPSVSNDNHSDGGYVAFYAAQTTQTTPEMRLPAGDPGRKPMGLFSYTLAEGLSSMADGVSYRQLAQFVLGRYRAQNLFSPTPLFTGSQMDAPVFGNQTQSPVRQWPVVVAANGSAGLRAGLLSQLNVGTVLDVLPGPLAAADQALGQLRVGQADVMSAQLVPHAMAGKPALDPRQLPKDAVARLTRPMLAGFQLRVALPAEANDADSRVVHQVINALRKSPPTGIEVSWVLPHDVHDLRLRVEGGQLWQLPPSAQWFKTGPHKTPSIRIQQADLQSKLAGNLQAIGRAQNLLRIASALQDNAAARGLEVQGVIKPAKGPTRQLDTLTAVAATAGDSVEFTLRNSGRSPIDVTALYVDSAYGVTALYPQPRGASNRIEPGDSDSLVIHIDNDTTGHERLLLIAVEAQAMGLHHDFSFLEQARLERTRSDVDRSKTSDIHAMFEEAGFGNAAATATRGAKPVASPERVHLKVFGFEVK